jgi:P-type Ca2+ transporter type 2C
MILMAYCSDGQSLHLLANELVPGDLVTFTTGDRVPADVRIVSAIDLEIDESSLTGETTARRKNAEPCRGSESYMQISSEPVALAERSCIGYMGTLVRNGKLVSMQIGQAAK